MKKYLLTIIIMIFCMGISAICILYHYYTEPSFKQPFKFHSNTSSITDTLNIAYIGDSWAFLHMNHSCKIEVLLESKLHRPVKVNSFGISGIMSKGLCERMYDDNNFINFLQSKNFRFCYISVGINDANAKMSTSYYTKSIDNIIQLLLENHIHPIIQEIPGYDIQSAYYRQRFIKRLFIRFSSYITNCPLDCKQIYRDALNHFIQVKKYTDKVSIIRYNTWNRNYLNDLSTLYRKDKMHLSDKGYEVLDSTIATVIAHKLSSN